MDRLVRQRLVKRVTHEWDVWRTRTGGSPEEYLAQLASKDSPMWREAVWFVSLVIASRMGELRSISGRVRLMGHHIEKRSVTALEQFWTTLFRIRTDVAVITTNYDILAERGLRSAPRPRVPRPGFNYGFGFEALAGRALDAGRSCAAGQVPLLKLHGSVSWSIERGELGPVNTIGRFVISLAGWSSPRRSTHASSPASRDSVAMSACSICRCSTRSCTSPSRGASGEGCRSALGTGTRSTPV